MPVYRLTPNRIAAISNLLRHCRCDGMMRVEKDPKTLKTRISIEIETAADGPSFLEDDGDRCLEPDDGPATGDDSHLRFSLLELD